jgi:hypothetical protein
MSATEPWQCLGILRRVCTVGVHSAAHTLPNTPSAQSRQSIQLCYPSHKCIFPLKPHNSLASSRYYTTKAAPTTVANTYCYSPTMYQILWVCAGGAQLPQNNSNKHVTDVGTSTYHAAHTVSHNAMLLVCLSQQHTMLHSQLNFGPTEGQLAVSNASCELVNLFCGIE